MSGFTKIADYTTYYTVENIINEYISYIKELNGDQNANNPKLNMTKEEVIASMQEEGIVSIKNILDKKYVEELNINDELIKESHKKYMKKGDYEEDVAYSLDIDSMFQKQLKNNISIILVNSQINDKSFNILIKLDKNNNTYSIFLEDYIAKYNYNESMNEKDINISNDSIQVNDYNKIFDINITEKYIVSQYFSEYRMKMLNDTQKAYELLNANYREKKYGSYENFEKYIKDKKDDIQFATIQSYSIREQDGKQEYICIDENGKYYIFIENGVADYNVILDTYTIDLPEFLDKYNIAKNEVKVGLNIQKVFDAINDGDYKYVYEKLDSTFKQNNFNTQEKFEQYIKAKFYKNNNVEHQKYEQRGDLYIYTVNVTDVTNEHSSPITQTFVMQLKEGTDFVMSFSVD